MNEKQTMPRVRTCCWLNEPSSRAVRFIVVKKWHRNSTRVRMYIPIPAALRGTLCIHKHTASGHEVSRNGKLPPCHHHDSCTWITERKEGFTSLCFQRTLPLLDWGQRSLFRCSGQCRLAERSGHNEVSACSTSDTRDVDVPMGFCVCVGHLTH